MLARFLPYTWGTAPTVSHVARKPERRPNEASTPAGIGVAQAICVPAADEAAETSAQGLRDLLRTASVQFSLHKRAFVARHARQQIKDPCTMLLSRARPALRNVARQQRMLSAAPQPVYEPHVACTSVESACALRRHWPDISKTPRHAAAATPE